MTEEKYDAIIVGGGFAGIYQLVHLRDLGLKCKLIEAGSDLGGTWFWNTYPGARVDSQVPIYEFSRPDLWKEWSWTEQFPGWKELQAYFAYVDNKLDLRKDCQFNTTVKQAHWNDQLHHWSITSDGEDGILKVVAHHLILCMGSASKPYTPELKGLETFRGELSHTARWPKEGIDTKGKRVGVIGTGASGIQVIQAIGKHVENLAVFQRTPSIALPMHRRPISKENQVQIKQGQEDIYRKLQTTSTGTHLDRLPRPMSMDSEEQIEATLQELWDQGGLHFWIASYQDIPHDKDSNYTAYAFWRKKVGERIKDPKKRESLVPAVPPHPFGSKRPCLEECFYEILNQENVDLIDVNATPIKEITPNGVKTTEKEHELDVLVLATGFDGHTGAFLDLDLRGVNGETIRDHWKDGPVTYLGMTIDNFPNLYFAYGPHGPTAFCNGPTCIEIQGSWIVQTIEYVGQYGITKFMATSHAALSYKKHVQAFFNATLLPLANSWYNGGNLPGKKREAYDYTGGVSAYREEIMEEIKLGYPGFKRERLLAPL